MHAVCLVFLCLYASVATSVTATMVARTRQWQMPVATVCHFVPSCLVSRFVLVALVVCYLFLFFLFFVILILFVNCFFFFCNFKCYTCCGCWQHFSFLSMRWDHYCKVIRGALLLHFEWRLLSSFDALVLLDLVFVFVILKACVCNLNGLAVIYLCNFFFSRNYVRAWCCRLIYIFGFDSFI